MRSARYSFRVHPAGAALLLAALLFWPSGQALGVAAALVWHEAAHLIALRLCGVRECRVEITPFGGMIDSRAFDRLAPRRQSLCAAAGVAGSALAAWGCLSFAPDTSFGRALFGANASLALVNCLPAWPLDGARTLVALAAAAGRERGMRRVLHGVSVALGAALVALALWGAWKGVVNPSLLAAGPYLWYASGEGRLGAGVRAMGEMEHPLRESAWLPADTAITAADEPPRALLGQLRKGRYQLLLQVNEKGALSKVWTQEEMLQNALHMEGIGESRA